MKPILFAKDETDFTTNGLGRLDCISCKVIEERNGMFELEAEIPVSSPHAMEVEYLSIIGAKAHDGGNIQAFTVYKITKPMNGRFMVYARHLSYRLSDIPCSPFTVAASPQAAANTLAGLKNNALEPCPFNFSTDVTTGNPYTQNVPASIRQRLGGVEGSVLDQFGGEFEFDNWNVKLWKSRGRLSNVTGISLRYGKNITDINQEEEIASTVTGVVPFWIDTDGNNLVTLPEHVVYADNAANYPYHITQVLDLSSEFEEKPTVAQLRGVANTYVHKDGFGVPKVSIKVSFANLWESEEYKDIAPLERVQLCDEVSVYFEKLGISSIAKVVKTDFDVLKERYNNVEVGSLRTTLAQAVTDRDKDIDTTFIQEMTRVSTAITNATAWLTNANGYVVAVKNTDGSWKELLFMNTNDPQTATQGIRFNNNGIGFWNKATDGGNVLDGPYGTAWTIDGRLGDFADKNFWNIRTGDFSLSASATVGGQTVQQIADSAQQAAENTAAAALAAQVAIYDADIADLQNQIDGNVTTWYYSGTPTLNNLPASQWTTTTDKDNHIGDIYYDSATGYAYRFMKDGNNYIWTKISDSDIEAALSEAQDAWDLADNKRRVFITQPVPPYDLGDLWVQGSDGDIKRCATAKTSTQTYAASDWVLASKYTDDSALTSWINGTYATDKTDLQNQIDGKAETWYQASDPSASWTTAALKAQHEGDLWYRTTDNTTWYYDGTAWVQQNVPTAVFDKIDGKAHIYTSQPTTPYNVGDLWFASTSSEIKVCITARATGSFVSSDWAKRDKYTDDTAVNALDSSLNQNEIFNRLIGGDTAQGIVLNNGKLYLRGNYLEAGEITIGGSAFANNPTLAIKDTSNRSIVEGTKDGLKVYNSNGTPIFYTTPDGVTTSKLVATGDCEFGNLKIGRKTVVTPIGEMELSYNYGEGWIEYWYEDFEGVLPKTQKKTAYFSPYYDGWADGYDVNVMFSCSEITYADSHESVELCRVNLHRWNGSSWSLVKTLNLNLYGNDLNDKDTWFDGFTANDKTVYRLTMSLYRKTWAEDYSIDVSTDYAHVFELNPYEITGNFRGHLEGSASLYSLAVGDFSVGPNGKLVYDDEDSTSSYNVSASGFSSATSSTNYTGISSQDAPSIKAQYNSNNYVEMAASSANVALNIYSSLTRYIKATATQFVARYDSSQYFNISSSMPVLEVYNSDSDYIYLDDTEVTVKSSSNTYAKFRGSASLVASRSGTSYSIPWTTSDRRFKEEIEPLDVELSKNLIDATETKKFKYKDTEGKHYGMIAQEAREVLDSLGETDAVLEHCTDEENKMNPRTIDYHEYIPHLINYVKDLRAVVDRQQAEIDQLKEIVKKLSM